MTTSVKYTANAGQTDFVIPFPSESPTHVKVKVDSVLASWSLFGTTTARLDTALTGGETVLIYRVTPVSLADLLVDFAPGARLTSDDLDTAIRQVAYAVEEIRERGVWAQVLDDATLDPATAGNRRIEDLSLPTGPNDAVNKTYADSLVLNSGDLPDPSAYPDGYGVMVVSAAWSVVSAASMLGYMGAYSSAQVDAAFLQITNALSELERSTTARASVQAADAVMLINPTVNNPGSIDIPLDPGGNWWQNSGSKLQISNGAINSYRDTRLRETSSVSRTSGSVNTDDFIGQIANRDARITPSSVSGTWRELSSGTVQSYTDDGAGNITGTGLDAASSIDYETGEITLRASGVENVEDGTITADYEEITLDMSLGYGDYTEQRIYLAPGDWRVLLNLTVKERGSSARTLKAALTDDVNSGSTVVHRHLWRTNSRALDIDADQTASYQYAWPITLASAGFVCLRAVADAAATLSIEALGIEIEQLSY